MQLRYAYCIFFSGGCVERKCTLRCTNSVVDGGGDGGGGAASDFVRKRGLDPAVAMIMYQEQESRLV
jgi:hypothetical protein